MAKAKKTKNFSESMEELESILEAIEEEEIDIDDLADQVERASELIKICRAKIEKTQTRIRGVMDDLE